ncbi:MAG: DNA-processing protein DprA [Candidatus Pacebacteria bacterium]|nr:DNA-processing protein DprA [Candidatus Paceibacterota bacterium]
MDNIFSLKDEQIPLPLRETPQPPKELFVKGELPSLDLTYLAVVGSRKHTSYGKEMCERLISGLKGYPVVIVSGLAFGIDSIAHKVALENNLKTIAFPGSGLDDSVIYPRTNVNLAKEIIHSGGCLISEMKPTERATLYSFPQRNRLMAGISKAVLIIEAEEKSGTLITARMALDYNRDVLVVPGSALSSNSKGTNKLIRQGATPITTSEELLESLGFDIQRENQTGEEKYASCGEEEIKIIKLLNEPKERDVLVRESKMDIAKANALLSIMEIKGLIKEELGELRKI